MMKKNVNNNTDYINGDKAQSSNIIGYIHNDKAESQ